jgi:hypothetical protein
VEQLCSESLSAKKNRFKRKKVMAVAAICRRFVLYLSGKAAYDSGIAYVA